MNSPRITPTVGRIVLFHLGATNAPREGARVFHTKMIGDTYAAVIADVISPRLVNLGVFDKYGSCFGQANIPLVQANEEVPGGSAWCEWMPYQKGQAAKTEQLEQQLATANTAADLAEARHMASAGEPLIDINKDRHPAIAAAQQLDNAGRALSGCSVRAAAQQLETGGDPSAAAQEGAAKTAGKMSRI